MTITISAEQRNALYEQVMIRLTGIGSELLAAVRSDLAEADRFGREYSDDLRLILDDLGWGEVRRETVSLTTPPEILRRVLGRVREAAVVRCEQAREEQVEAEKDHRQNEFVKATCDQVLGQLGPEIGQLESKDARGGSLV